MAFGGRTKGTRVGNGPGKGDGWGGPAQGFVQNDAKAPQFEPGNEAAKLRDPLKIRARNERIEAIKDALYEMSFTEERAETRLAAMNAYLNRAEGLPIARSITEETLLSKLTDDDLDQLIDSLRAVAGAGGPSTNDAGASAESEAGTKPH